MIVRGFAVICIVVTTGSVSISADAAIIYAPGNALVGSHSSESVYRIDLDARTESELGRYHLPIRELRTSPDGAVVGFVRASDRHGYSEIVFVDPSGKRISEVRTGIDFAWNPVDGGVALTSGYRDQFREWHSSGLWLARGPDTYCERLSGDGFYVHWARFDGRIYIRMNMTKGRVVAYDPKTKTQEGTPYKDILFSPDGKYYYAFTDEAAGLFLREGNEDVTQRHAFLKTDDAKSQPRWVAKSLLAFAAAKKPDQEYLFNADDGLTLLVPGKVLAMGKEDKSVHISAIPDGAIKEIPLEKCEVLHPGQPAPRS